MPNLMMGSDHVGKRILRAIFPGMGGFTRYNLYAVGISLLFNLTNLYATLFCTIW